MTERLYLMDSYLRSFRARVLEVRELDGRPAAILDRTAFYPEGGGQPGDRGTLGGVKVLDIQERGGAVLHVLDQALQPGEVAAEIDWTRRFDHMQQHHGQHLLSAAFDKLGAPTVSFHLGERTCTIDLDAPPAQVDGARAEAIANESIWRDLPVVARDFTGEERAKLPLRKEPVKGDRVVLVDGVDASPCGGTHPARRGGFRRRAENAEMGRREVARRIRLRRARGAIASRGHRYPRRRRRGAEDGARRSCTGRLPHRPGVAGAQEGRRRAPRRAGAARGGQTPSARLAGGCEAGSRRGLCPRRGAGHRPGRRNGATGGGGRGPRPPGLRPGEGCPRTRHGRASQGRPGRAGWKGGWRSGLRAGQRGSREGRRRAGACGPQARTPLNSHGKAAVLGSSCFLARGATYRFHGA